MGRVAEQVVACWGRHEMRQGRDWEGWAFFFFGEKRRSEELVEKLVGRLGSRGDREGELVEKLGGEERRGIAAMIPSFFFISISSRSFSSLTFFLWLVWLYLQSYGSCLVLGVHCSYFSLGLYENTAALFLIFTMKHTGVLLCSYPHVLLIHKLVHHPPPTHSSL